MFSHTPVSRLLSVSLFVVAFRLQLVTIWRRFACVVVFSDMRKVFVRFDEYLSI